MGGRLIEPISCAVGEAFAGSAARQAAVVGASWAGLPAAAERNAVEWLQLGRARQETTAVVCGFLVGRGLDFCPPPMAAAVFAGLFRHG